MDYRGSCAEVVRLHDMLRYTSLVLLAACAGAPPKPQPAPLASTQSSTAYQLEPRTVRGMEGRHSASHSSSQLAGSLQLAGERAHLVVEITTTIGYVHCPGNAQSFGRQACADRSKTSDTVQQKLDLTGTAVRDGDRVRITVGATTQPDPARPPQRYDLVLACREVRGSLACNAVVDNSFDLMGRAGVLTFDRVRVEPQPRAPRLARY
jgi:hypothetical protein